MKSCANNLVLTGASGGLGQAMAVTLAGLCDNMVLVGRDITKLQAMQHKLRSNHPALNTELIAGDLTDENVRQRIFGAALALRRPLDLLINNAGITDFHEFELQQRAPIEHLIAVNLLAPMHLSRILLPLLKSAPRGQIVNIGSILGYLGYPGYAAYCASKFGLRGFSQSLRRELADTSVEVRYFAPRATRTSMNTTAVSGMNHELGTQEDAPDTVAQILLTFLKGSAWERKIGFPERLFVVVNQLLPAVVDSALRAKLLTIRKYLTRN
jgi:short-subunit dehydrogenase